MAELWQKGGQSALFVHLCRSLPKSSTPLRHPPDTLPTP